MARDVHLVGADDDRRRLAGPVEVGDRGRVDDLALIFVFVIARGHVGVERRLVARRVDGGDLFGVLDEHREALDGFAVGVPRVHVAILAGGNDVEARSLFGFEVCEHGRGREADLGALARAASLGLPRGVARRRRARVVRVRRPVEDELAFVPRVDVPLPVVGDDVHFAIARQVARRGRLEHRVVVRGGETAAAEGVLSDMQGQRVGVHGPARQVAEGAGDGVALIGVDQAVGVGDDELIGVVAGEVDEQRARVTVAFHFER